MPDVEAFLLAGGLSRRMGHDKSRLRVGGRTLAALSADAAKTLGIPVRILRQDDVPRCGPIGGMFTALSRARAPVVLFLCCDMPRLGPALLQRLLDGLGEDAPAAFLDSDGWVGFPFALRRTAEALDRVRSRIAKGEYSLQQLPAMLGAVRVRVAGHETDQLLNVNTPDALAEFRSSSSPKRRTRSGGNPARFLPGLFAAWASLAAGLAAGLPDADRWQPTNTVASLTVPDVEALRAAWHGQPPGRLWGDPTMAPFRHEAEARMTRTLLDPLSQLLGVPIREIPDLAKGQFTIALVDESSPRGMPGSPSPVLLIEAEGDGTELGAWLGRRSGPKPDTFTQLNGFEVARWTIAKKSLEERFRAAFPDPDPSVSVPVPEGDHWIHVGRKGRVLVASSSTNLLEFVTRRLGEAALAPAGSQKESPTALARIALSANALLGWLPQGPMSLGGLTSSDEGPTARKIVSALGLNRVRSLACSIRADARGWWVETQLDWQGPTRPAFLALVPWLASDASPLPFVPASSQSFVRARFAGKPAWAGLEKLLQQIDPSLLGVLHIFTGYAGKTEDADFDFQKGLVERLGDDWTWATIPVEDDHEPASLLVVGSPLARELHQAIRLVVSPTYLSTFFPPDSSSPTRAESLSNGFPITSISLPPMPWRDGATGAVHVTHRGNFVALASHPVALAAFLATNPVPTLSARPGFESGKALAGGATNGYASFADERQVAAAWFEESRKTSGALARRHPWIVISPMLTRVVLGVDGWLDGRLLPPFPQVTDHFGPRYTSGRESESGLAWTTFRPSLSRER